MSRTKLTVEFAERRVAMQTAGAMQDLLDPPPEALSVFEEMSDGTAAPIWRIEAFFAEPREPMALTQELENLLGVPIPPIKPAVVPDLNWVAISQAALPPVRTNRFAIHGSHDRNRIPQGPNAILIEAGEAFGTAHHATTYGCMLAIAHLARRRTFRRVLDLGCGSGILAIAAARAWPKAAIAGIDIDAQSVAVAKENARTNRVGGRIEFICGDGAADPGIRRRAPFDLIVANILAEPLIAMARKLRRVAEDGAIIVLSGLLTRESPAVIAAYRAQGMALLDHRRHDGWSTLMLVKRSLA